MIFGLACECLSRFMIPSPDKEGAPRDNREKEITMKGILVITIVSMFCFSCASERADWDSGGQAQDAFRQQRQEDNVESTRQQLPTAGETTVEEAQPF